MFAKIIKPEKNLNWTVHASTSFHPLPHRLPCTEVVCFGNGIGVAYRSDMQSSQAENGFPAPDVYVKAGSNKSSFKFNIPVKGCGTVPSGGFGKTVDNIIVIQTDDDVQEAWDIARKVSCATTSLQEKTVLFRPFVVDMLEVVSVPVTTGTVDCWMDIRRGYFPNTSPLGEIIKIGEPLTVLVYIKDRERRYDVRVRDCWAYDSEDYEAADTHRLQLTGPDGCPKKRKLIGYWQTTTDVGNTDASIIAYNNISAFKFPDRMQVYLTCNIEICSGQCTGKCQESQVTTVQTELPPNCYPGSNDPRCPRTTTQQIPTSPQCYPGSLDPRCPQPPTTTSERPQCYPGSTDPRCPKSSTTTTTPFPRCFPGSTDPRCLRPTTTSTQPPLHCYPGSLDSRCPQTTTFTPPSTTAKLVCYPGSTDPRCPKTTPTTERQLVCYPGSTDSRCPKPPTTPRCFPGSTDPRCPPPYTTPATPACYPGSPDPRCPQTTLIPSTYTPVKANHVVGASKEKGGSLGRRPGGGDEGASGTSVAVEALTCGCVTRELDIVLAGGALKMSKQITAGNVMREIVYEYKFRGLEAEYTGSIVKKLLQLEIPVKMLWVRILLVLVVLFVSVYRLCHSCYNFFVFHECGGLFEPQKIGNRRKIHHRSIDEENISQPHHVTKREIEQQVVAITIGVRGLMVGTDKDLHAHSIVKRELQYDSHPQEVQGQLTLTSVTIIATIAVIIGAVVAGLYAFLRIHKKRITKSERVITTMPQLK
uniref:Mucin-2-like protein n=1 Tax=Locusta migratoria TaxID=7004 RepID=A0A7D4WZD1_LOCMI|nr:mucin-2-like protein [Locusta migratoria]